MITALRLPFTFDAGALKAELRRIEAEEWEPHFNQQYYEGVWSGVALRSVGGAASQLFPDPSQAQFYADTPVLERLPYFKYVIETFKCSLESVRLLKLEAGSHILEHKDYDLGFLRGVIRVHIPVQTDPNIKFYLNGERVLMSEGESWYLDLSLPHRVDNDGTQDRIHLVLDCVVNDWVKALFE